MDKNILTDAEISYLFSQFKDTQDTFIQRVIKALPDFVYVMKLDDYSLIYSSGLMTHEIGYSKEEIEQMKHPMLDIMHPADRTKFIEHLDQLKESIPGEVLSIEYRLIRKDGKIAWFIDRNTLFTTTNKDVLTKIGVTHQITARKEYEQILLKKEKIAQQSEILAQLGSWDYNSTTKMFTWSDGMYILFNLPIGSEVHPSVYKDFCIEEDAHIAERIVDSIEIHNNSLEEILQIKVNGGIKIIKIIGDPVLDITGSMQFVGVDQDITITERNQEQLKTLNKELTVKNHDIEVMHEDLKTFSEITSSTYHTNLKHIYTAFEAFITSEAMNVSSHGKGALRKIQGSIQKINLLTHDIEQYLSIAIDKSTFRLISLDDILADIIHDLKSKMSFSNITIHKNELGFVTGDLKLITILFRNLLENAIKFRREEGETVISITASVDSVIHDENGQRNLIVSIEDNGIGIMPEDREQVFDLFFKNHHDRKIKGSGVGLAVVKKIMGIHTGKIYIVSTEKPGIRFILHFPIDNLK